MFKEATTNSLVIATVSVSVNSLEKLEFQVLLLRNPENIYVFSDVAMIKKFIHILLHLIFNLSLEIHTI